MNLSEHQSLIGRRGALSVQCGAGTLRFEVTVVDARRVYGRTDYLIAPVSGFATGATWVSADRVTLDGVQ